MKKRTFAAPLFLAALLLGGCTVRSAPPTPTGAPSSHPMTSTVHSTAKRASPMGILGQRFPMQIIRESRGPQPMAAPM